ncbi:hypothetical protein HHK36_001748 [Tetracentron sinense]|uniref:Prephenate/arogenate dehydrogenase domain-containing protein n=1 Tax=Tetracentron sinense TaxID=13715 RepID=A0A834ZY19_TETSI|nr:hypothetical protein HHK36_001748 [Tetracentron sinense]
MATSIHFCHCKAQTHPNLSAYLAPNTTFTTSYRSKSSTFSKLRLKYVPLRHTHISNHLEKSSESLIASAMIATDDPLKIGILGFGNFGQFIAKALKRQGHAVLATSRSDYSEYCQQNGIEFFRNIDGLCEEQPDVILVCSSILSTETVVRGIPMHKLKPDTIFVDVLSVKQFPRNLFLDVLPPEFGIICTHPMFGPESGKHGWAGLPFVHDKVRITENNVQDRKCAQFLSIFEQEGCRMVEMSCEEHDRHAAGSQFITHTIGRILSHLDLESTPINTKGYETLLQLTENTVSDSFDLYYGLFMYNIENLDRAFETVKQKLFGRLHDILRKQIVGRVPPKTRVSISNPTTSFLPNTDNMKDLSSFAMPSLAQENHDESRVASTMDSLVPH